MKNDILTYYNNNPGIEIQDIFKYLYQSCYGPEHLVSDYDSAYGYIVLEAKGALSDKIYGIEPIGNGYVRLHLNALYKSISPEALTRVFILSSIRQNHETSSDEWILQDKLDEFTKLVRDGAIGFNFEETLKETEKWKSLGYEPCHHSKKYRDLYHPAYRVVREDILNNMKYCYFGAGQNVKPVDDSKYAGINSPDELYDALTHIWCENTCAPRMRDKWTKENYTLGQCSVTAFLVQDIFGGKVYGIPLPDGGYHCYNVVGDAVFDLTSEQFTKKLYYSKNSPEQFRDVHFSKEEKRLRYEYLREGLAGFIQKK